MFFIAFMTINMCDLKENINSITNMLKRVFFISLYRILFVSVRFTLKIVCVKHFPFDFHESSIKLIE